MAEKFAVVPATDLAGNTLLTDANMVVREFPVLDPLTNGVAVRVCPLNFWSPPVTPGITTAPAAFTAGQVDLLDSPSPLADTLTLARLAFPDNGGSALTGLQYAVDSGSGFGAEVSIPAVLGNAQIPVLPNTPATVRVRAVNIIGPGPWFTIPAIVTPTFSGTSSLSRIEPWEWAAIPSGDAGGVWLMVPTLAFGAGTAEQLQYRFQQLDDTPNARVLNDPTGAWSAWTSAGASAGRIALTGLPTVPCAIQIRGLIAGQWTKESRFKRIGDRHFNLASTVTTIPGAVAQTLPASIPFGALGIYGEQRQRVANGVTAITAGNAAGHFEIVVVSGRSYLQLSPTGVASATGSYALTLNNGGGTANVTILANTMVAASRFDTHVGTLAECLTASVAEVQAFWGRNGTGFGAASGKTLLFRTGFFDFSKLTGNAVLNHNALDNATDRFTMASADPAQPAMVAKFAIKKAASSTGLRNVSITDIDFYAPSFLYPTILGSGTSGHAVEITEGAVGSTHIVKRNIVRGDGIEARYGHNIRGGGVHVRQTGVEMTLCAGLDMTDNTILYTHYPLRLEGCDGLVKNNLVTHNEVDYFNVYASVARESGPLVRNNYFAEHTGDQYNTHSDGMHSWLDGTFRSFSMEGNIWNKGFEGNVCPGGLPANFLYYPENPPLTLGTFTTGSAAYENEYFALATPGRITLHTPGTGTLNPTQPTGGSGGRKYATYTFGGVNVSDGVIEIVGPGIFITLNPFDRAMVYEDFPDGPTLPGVWKEEKPSNGFQWAIYQNDGNVQWYDCAFRYNIGWGPNSPSLGLLDGMTQRRGIATAHPESAGFYNHNNGVCPGIATLADDDRDRNGILDERDGVGFAAPNNGYGQRLSAFDGINYTTPPKRFADFKNIGAGQPPVAEFAGLDTSDQITFGAANAETTGARRVYQQGPDFPMVLNTRADVIARMRAEAGSLAHTRYIGPVGPTDDAVGFWNYATGERNGYPALVPEFCSPAQNGSLPLGTAPLLKFPWPVVRGPGAVSITPAAGGAGLATTVEMDGRTVRFAASMTDGVAYDLIVAADAIRHYDDAANDWVGCAAGVYRFTASSLALPNIIAQQDGAFPPNPRLQFLDGAFFSPGTDLRFDTTRYEDNTPFMPTVPATLAVGIKKGSGTVRTIAQIFTGLGSVSITVNVNIATGAVTSSINGVEGVDFGVIDRGDNWRVWYALPSVAQGLTRYLLRLNTTGVVCEYCKPMVAATTARDAAFVAVLAPFSASSIAPVIGSISGQSWTQNTGVQTVDAGAVTTGSNLVYSLTTSQTGITINSATGVISVNTGTTGALAGVSVTVRATDSVSGLFGERTFAVTVAAAVATFINGTGWFTSPQISTLSISGKLTAKARVKMNSLAATTQLFHLSGAQGGLEVMSTGALRLAAFRDSANTALNTSTLTSTGAVNTTDWATILMSIDLPNQVAQVWLNGVEVIEVALAANTGLLSQTRLLSLLGTNTGGSLVQAEIEYLRVWNDARQDGADPAGAALKVITGPASTANADGWQLGGDFT